MKTAFQIRPAAAGAFTLTEMMISTSLFMMVVGGVIYGYVFGLRMFELSRAKMCATDDARRAINKMVDDIRGATWIRIGNGSLTNFTEITGASLQKGSAVQVYPTKVTNDWVRYFYHSPSKQLRRTEDGVNSFVVLANSVTNQMIFSSEDFTGQILTNNFNNRVIGVKLEFASIQYPMMSIGPTNYFDYYQLRTKITRRKLE